jgi:hypothetical protein
MSEENEFDGNEGEGIKSLRKEFNALKKQNEEKDAALGKYQAARTQLGLHGPQGHSPEGQGTAEKAASLYTGDDVSEDAVGKWLESYADVFGAAPQQQTSTTVIDANAQAAQRTSEAAYENARARFRPARPGVHGDPDELRSDAALPVRGAREARTASGAEATVLHPWS